MTLTHKRLGLNELWRKHTYKKLQYMVTLICTEKMRVFSASVICLKGKGNYHEFMNCYFLSTVILFLFCFLFMHNGERHQVKATKQYMCQDDKTELGIQLTRIQKGISWHCVKCNLLLKWQQCKEKHTATLLCDMICRISAFLWQPSVWRFLSIYSFVFLSFRKQRSRGKHGQWQRWQHLWKWLRLLQTEWRWEML